MNILYVDDDSIAIDLFRQKISLISDVQRLDVFTNGEDALRFAEHNVIDIAFLDVVLPGISGLVLASRLKVIDINIKIIFLTASDQYAFQAFQVGALGYLLKPCTKEDVEKEINKAKLLRPIPRKRVSIRTIPHFNMYVDGVPFFFNSAKAKELLAFLVDKNGVSVTAGQVIAALWEDKPDNDSTHALYRMTWKRLRDTLTQAGIDYILSSDPAHRYVLPDMYENDLNRLMEGDERVRQAYNGDYMSEYSWAEETNAMIVQLLHKGYV